MNDRDLLADGRAHGERVEELLRRAGFVEQDPPAHVREAVVQAVRDQRRADHARTSLATARDARSRRGAVSERRSGRWGGGLRLLAAAAAGALVTWTGLSLLDPAEEAQVVASAELAALTADGTEGRAEVVRVDGHQRLRVELQDVPDAGEGYLEVWLLRPDVSGMVTLGVLDGTTAEFTLPDGLDLGEYAVVDISREHMDGDPGHGGDSLVRGQVG